MPVGFRAVADAELAGRGPGWRQWGMTAVKIVFLVAVVVGGVAYIVEHRVAIWAAVSSMNPGWLVVAFVAVLGALVLSMLSWKVLWPAFGVRLRVVRGARLYFISQLGKYLPGSVWTIAAQAQMAGEIGASRSSSIVLSLIALLVSVALGLGIGVTLLPFIDPHLLGEYWWVVIVGVALLACLVPTVLRLGVRLALTVLRRPSSAFTYDWVVAARTSGAQAANWLLGGLQLWLILIGLGVDPGRSLLPSIAAFALASSLGILLIPFPAGLGVREFVITLVLTSVTDAETAVAAALLSRLLYVFADFGLASLGIATGRRARAVGR
jgi:glycosyltransferase 2 family protein